MSDRLRIVLDGTLFAECELYGKNRDGMTRLAESITEGLVRHAGLDVRFASTVYMQKYDVALKAFVHKNYSAHSQTILTRDPLRVSNVLRWKQLFRNAMVAMALSPRL